MNDLMNIIRSGADIITNGKSTLFFDWIVAHAVRGEMLDTIVIGVLASVLVVLMSGIAMAVAGVFSPKASAQQRPQASAEQPNRTDRRFAIYKKPRSRHQNADRVLSAEPSPQDGPQDETQDETQVEVQDASAVLTGIERDMLALRELYESGHITKDVYIAEISTLHEQAKNYI